MLLPLRSAIQKIPVAACRHYFTEQVNNARPRLLIALGCVLFLLFDLFTGSDFLPGVLPGIAWIILIAAMISLAAEYGSLFSDLRFFGKESTLVKGVITAATGEKKKRFSVVFFTGENTERTWETGLLDADTFSTEQEVKVAWMNSRIQRAALIRPDGKPEGLSRSFTRKLYPAARTDFAALHCLTCGGAVPLSEEDHFPCPYCGGNVRVSKAQQQALADAKRIAEDNRRIVEEWRSLAAIRLRTGLYRTLNSLPFVLLAGGLLMLLSDSLHAFDAPVPLFTFLHEPQVKIGYWAIVIAVTIAGAWYSPRNLWANDTRSMLRFFAARRPENPHHPFSCRNCGSALTLRIHSAYCICPYCRSENFILPDETRISQLHVRKDAFGLLLEDTVQLCRIRRKSGLFFSVGRGLSIGLLALPLYFLYAGNGIRPPDAWTLAVALDIFFLGVCAFWIFREAWLPPVEDTDWLPAAFAEATREAGPATRRWADFSMEKKNFLWPLLLVALYAAAEIIAGAR